jgi:hypothetical protein
MNIDDLLTRLDNVKPRGSRWTARCPAHADKNPSLSIREGERGILLHCFANCTLQEICAALHVEPRALFYDSRVDLREQRTRVRERVKREQSRHAAGLESDLYREARQVVNAARGLDITRWSNETLDRELNRLANAYAILERGGLNEHS